MLVSREVAVLKAKFITDIVMTGKPQSPCCVGDVGHIQIQGTVLDADELTFEFSDSHSERTHLSPEEDEICIRAAICLDTRPVAPPAQGSSPLTAASLAAAPPHMQKQMLESERQRREEMGEVNSIQSPFIDYYRGCRTNGSRTIVGSPS